MLAAAVNWIIWFAIGYAALARACWQAACGSAMAGAAMVAPTTGAKPGTGRGPGGPGGSHCAEAVGAGTSRVVLKIAPSANSRVRKGLLLPHSSSERARPLGASRARSSAPALGPERSALAYVALLQTYGLIDRYSID